LCSVSVELSALVLTSCIFLSQGSTVPMAGMLGM
jgi:hypothetical protein